jgi:hypothetical protein
MSNADLTRTLSAPRQHRERLRARHVREALLSIVALAVVFAVGIMLLGAHNPFQSTPTAARPGRGETTTATITLAPDRGERCKRLLFDNRSGAFQDAGTAHCGANAPPADMAEGGGGPSAAHLDRIRESFRAR